MVVQPLAAGLIVVSVGTGNHSRVEARLLIRQALRQVLAPLLGCSVDAVPLDSQAGQPVRLTQSSTPIGLAISHEAGLSIGAVNMHGLVGIDLMRVGTQLDLDWQAVARDYLGPSAVEPIAGYPVAAQAQAFAQAWTSHEARLKCHSLPLQEWTAQLDLQLRQCCMTSITLPTGFVGALATASAPQFRIVRFDS